MKNGSRKGKSFKNVKYGKQRFRHSRNGDSHDNEPAKKIGLHWILLGFSIAIVTCLSFMNFVHLSTRDAPVIAFNLRGAAGVDRADMLAAGTVVQGNGFSVSMPPIPPMASLASQSALPPLSQSTLPPISPSGVASPNSMLGHERPKPVASFIVGKLYFVSKDIVYPGQYTIPAGAVGKLIEVDEIGDVHIDFVDPMSVKGVKWILKVDQEKLHLQDSTNTQALLHPTSSLPLKLSEHAASTHSSGGGIAIFEGESWLRYPSQVDAPDIIFGAWIFLPNAPVAAFPQSSQSMKTIAATKVSGCGKIDNSDGWALFVHEWGTFNQQLRLSWSDHVSACHELYSETNLVKIDRWVHVAFSLSATQNTAKLFIDGAVIADTKLRIGSYAKAGKKLSFDQVSLIGRTIAKPGLILGAHMPQPSDALQVQSHAFFGFMGDVRLLQIAPASPEDANVILMSTVDSLLSHSSVPRSSIVLQVEIQATKFVQNTIDRKTFVEEPHGRPELKHISIISYTPDPKHPWFKENEAAASIPSTPLEALPTLSPDAVESTWPREWTEKFDRETLMASQRRSDTWAEDVRAAMVHTWRGYKAKAWGHDDLKPLSGRPKDWCRLGIFILDSLTTLWLMDLHDEFTEAEEWLKVNTIPTPGSHGMHSLFEMTIRGFGGLLGAYALTGRQIFLDNARNFGDIMLKAFDTPSGIPKSQIDVGTGATKWHTWVKYALLAEVGTVQVEMRYLSHSTGDDKYKKVGDKAFDTILKISGEQALVPLYMTTQDETPKWGNSKISLGAMGDSYYEYLLKQWIQSGKTEDRLKNKWKDAMREMLDELVKKTAGGLTYICEKDNNKLRHRMDHLACFVAGMLIMGARELPKAEVDPRWEPTAAELTRTCHEMYKRSPSGLSPEYVVFNQNAQTPKDMTTPNDAPHNLLRPEAAEAMYYMWYYTGDPMYREWAHEMFEAFNKNAKTKIAFAAIKDVRQKPAAQRDDMESFWAAETLKYLYLIQMPRSKLNLDEYVFNTEAHPMRRWVGK